MLHVHSVGLHQQADNGFDHTAPPPPPTSCKKRVTGKDELGQGITKKTIKKNMTTIIIGKKRKFTRMGPIQCSCLESFIYHGNNERVSDHSLLMRTIFHKIIALAIFQF